MTGIRGPRIERTGRGGRWYVWHKRRYWSVTTIISGGLPKPVLVNWAKKVTAEAAVANLDVLAQLAADSPEGAIDWLKRAPDRTRDKAGNIGSLVHAASEAYVLGRPYPEWGEAQAPYMASFLAWLHDFTPEFVAVEAPCFSIKHRYAGTLDAIAVINGKRYLLDYKSGKGVYPEVGLQLAAYRFSESFIGLPDGTEEPTPKVDECAVVHLRPEGYEFVPIRADEEVFRAFLYVREVYRFAVETADTIVGAPWQPDGLLERQLAESLEASGEDGTPRPGASENPVEVAP